MIAKQFLSITIFIACFQSQISYAVATPELGLDDSVTSVTNTVALQNCLVDTGNYSLPSVLMVQPLSRENLFLPESCNMTYEGIAWLSDNLKGWNVLIVMYFFKCDLLDNYSSPELAVLEFPMRSLNCSDAPQFYNVKVPYPGVMTYCTSHDIFEYCGIVANNTLMLFISKDDTKTTAQVLKNLGVVIREEKNRTLRYENIRGNYIIANFANLERMFTGLTTGEVKSFNRAKRVDIIAGDDGKNYIFHANELKPSVSINEGDKVIFGVVKGEKGLEADNVNVYSPVSDLSITEAESNVSNSTLAKNLVFVTIDPYVCVSCGTCVEEYPELFQLDENEIADFREEYKFKPYYLHNYPKLHATVVSQKMGCYLKGAVDACPSEAITISSDGVCGSATGVCQGCISSNCSACLKQNGD
jgi:ferredoxin/cold shock CspA family protein